MLEKWNMYSTTNLFPHFYQIIKVASVQYVNAIDTTACMHNTVLASPGRPPAALLLTGLCVLVSCGLASVPCAVVLQRLPTYTGAPCRNIPSSQTSLLSQRQTVRAP